MQLTPTVAAVTPTSLHFEEVWTFGHVTNPAPYRARHDEEISERFRQFVDQLTKATDSFDAHIVPNLELYVRTVNCAWKEFVRRGIRTPDDVASFERGARKILKDCWDRQKEWNQQVRLAQLAGATGTPVE